MLKSLSRSVLFILATTVFAYAAEFPGRYEMQGGDAVLSISEPNDGSYSATIYANGEAIAMRGRVTAGRLVGTVDDGSGVITFEAESNGPQLTLTLIENDATGRPVPGARQSLAFTRKNASQSATAAAGAGDVVINGRTLSRKERNALTKRYGVAPIPGNYWYDSSSGLYGVVGYQAFGFMMPGHSFGQLQANASKGNTQVFINGRELPQGEWMVWSYMLGTPILAGSYWLDASGNAGYAGSPMPIVNLYAAARQNSYNGQGGSGDNFWSSRFSAGNSDGDRGYVSVPGHGPVGYGF